MRFVTRKRLAVLGTVLTLSGVGMKLVSSHALRLYGGFDSRIIYDRRGDILNMSTNAVGLYSVPITEIPKVIETALLTKEDRYFFYHPGVNPFSIVRDVLTAFFRGHLSGSSTLTQQLAKILLHHENDRTVLYKLEESIYAVSLELFTSKQDILLMYANVAYFGRQAQGVGEASRYYFGKSAEDLTPTEAHSLVAALGNPSARYPGTRENSAIAAGLGKLIADAPLVPAEPLHLEPRKSSEGFELASLPLECTHTCSVTIDKKLSESIREIVSRNLASPAFSSARNAAVVVIKQPENELLAVVGTPDPTLDENGYKINMAVEPRPIGSTIKPFIYMKAFEKGARPYTLVDDREYTYSIGTGFSIYPKNYDGRYRGHVTLHSALVNSLNVPAVKVLEYITPPVLYELLEGPLSFVPIQPLDSYDLGIALGGLEMDLLTLTHYFTLFPAGGVVRPLVLGQSGAPRSIRAPMEATVVEAMRVVPAEHVELVTRIISDRATGVDQFGLASNLNLPYKNYAVKTGTSRDFHDSWTIGYTPDFVVGVWVGNHDNTPMREVSGQSGAGKIWHEAMELLYTTEYNKNSEFSSKNLVAYPIEGTMEYGLANDDIAEARQELLKNDTAFITNPHDGDRFQFVPGTTIQLRSKEAALWTANGVNVGHGHTVSWRPEASGSYTIYAKSDSHAASVAVSLTP